MAGVDFLTCFVDASDVAAFYPTTKGDLVWWLVALLVVSFTCCVLLVFDFDTDLWSSVMNGATPTPQVFLQVEC